MCQIPVPATLHIRGQLANVSHFAVSCHRVSRTKIIPILFTQRRSASKCRVSSGVHLVDYSDKYRNISFVESYNCFLLRSNRVMLTDKLLSGEYIYHLGVCLLHPSHTLS